MKIFLSTKIFIITILFVINCLHLSGQKASNEFIIFGGGGFSFFHFQPAISDASSAGFSGDFGAGYTYFFSQRLGVHFGAGLGLFNVKAKIGKFNFVSHGLYDSNNYLFDLHSNMTDYKENHTAPFMSIPLMLQYQSKMSPWYWKKDQRTYFYLLCGVKMFILPKSNYETNIATLYNAAYYPEFDNWAATQAFAGLGHFEGVSSDGAVDFGVIPVFAVETGIKRRISSNILLYTGIFFDYALIDHAKSNRTSPSNYAVNYLTEANNLPLLAFNDRIHLSTVGIKLRLGFFHPAKKQRRYIF